MLDSMLSELREEASITKRVLGASTRGQADMEAAPEVHVAWSARAPCCKYSGQLGEARATGGVRRCPGEFPAP